MWTSGALRCYVRSVYYGQLLGGCFSPKTICLGGIINAARWRQDLTDDLPVSFQAVLLRCTGGRGQTVRGESIVVAIRSEHNTWVVDMDSTKFAVPVLARDFTRRGPVVPRVRVIRRFGRLVGWRRSGEGHAEERRKPQGESREAGFNRRHDG